MNLMLEPYNTIWKKTIVKESRAREKFMFEQQRSAPPPMQPSEPWWARREEREERKQQLPSLSSGHSRPGTPSTAADSRPATPVCECCGRPGLPAHARPRRGPAAQAPLGRPASAPALPEGELLAHASPKLVRKGARASGTGQLLPEAERGGAKRSSSVPHRRHADRRSHGDGAHHSYRHPASGRGLDQQDLAMEGYPLTSSLSPQHRRSRT